MLIDNNYCFACGSKNPDGLKLEFKYSDDGSKAETTYIPPEKFQGWKGIVHGGIITTLLDELMAKAAINKGYQILTGEITTRFKNPAKTLKISINKIGGLYRKIIVCNRRYCRSGGIGRHARFRTLWGFSPWRFESSLRHHFTLRTRNYFNCGFLFYTGCA